MMSTAFTPPLHFGSDPRGSTDTTPEPVSLARSAGNREILRIVIANPQPIVRHGLRALIVDEPDLHLIGEVDDGDEAVRMVRQLRPDVVLIDLWMPTVAGLSATRTIRAELPNTQVVVTSGIGEDTSAIEAIRAGAAAYLVRDVRIDELLGAIRGAGAAQVALPARVATRMLHLSGDDKRLSHRETKVLYLVARGLANKQIARQLGIMESTVKTYVSVILSKLGLASRTQLALYAARNGLVALDDLSSDTAVGTGERVLGA